MGIEKGRFGQFFLFIGVIALVIFFSWGQEATAPFILLLGGAISVIAGGVLIWKDWKPGPQSGRFRILKGMKRKNQKKEEKKQK